MTGNSGKIILDLCGGSGAWSRPYKEAGYDVRVVTLPIYDVTHVGFGAERIDFYCRTPETRNEMMPVRYHDVYGIFAVPPCTYFSVARGRRGTPEELQRA